MVFKKMLRTKKKQQQKKDLPEKNQKNRFIFLCQFANVYVHTHTHTQIGSFFLSFPLQFRLFVFLVFPEVLFKSSS